MEIRSITVPIPHMPYVKRCKIPLPTFPTYILCRPAIPRKPTRQRIRAVVLLFLGPNPIPLFALVLIFSLVLVMLIVGC